MTEPHPLEDILKHRFANPRLLRQALRHPSFVAELPEEAPHNQRMEFLGDAVLQLSLSLLLYKAFPHLDEGILTRLRTTVVRTEALADFGAGIGLGEHLLLGKGEEQNGGRERASNLADGFEAVLAALYLDGGAAAADPVCRRLMNFVIQDEPETLLADENPKGALQEFVALQKEPPPQYIVEAVKGPEHVPRFEMSVQVGGEIVGRAVSGSRKEAEQECAKEALRHFGVLGPPTS